MRADQITLHRAHSIDQIFQSRLLYNLDSRHYPKNEVNFRISGTVLDSAMQDSCKYSTYIHVSISLHKLRFLSIFRSKKIRIITKVARKLPRLTNS